MVGCGDLPDFGVSRYPRTETPGRLWMTNFSWRYVGKSRKFERLCLERCAFLRETAD
jgi:hypothetical protein